jgi:hypothetical protein
MSTGCGILECIIYMMTAMMMMMMMMMMMIIIIIIIIIVQYNKAIIQFYQHNSTINDQILSIKKKNMNIV